MNGFTRELRGIYIIWLRDIKRFFRDKPRIIGSIVQPTLYLFILGVGLQNTLRLGGGSRGIAGIAGFNYVKFLFPGIIAMSVLFTAIFSAISIIWDREFGFLKEILVAPISRSSVAIGKALGGSTAAVFQGVILLVYSPFLGIGLSFIQVVKIVMLAMLIAFSLTSLGMVVATRMKSMEGFQVIMNFLLMPMLFLSGAFFPLQGLPKWLNYLVKIDPLAYGVDALRGTVLGNIKIVAPTTGKVMFQIPAYPIATDIAVMALFGLIMMVVAVYEFTRQE